MRVLLVEDDAETAAYICGGLGARGVEVQHAADGLQGHALACAGQYEALILDRRLPGLDGLSLLKRLREAGVRSPALYLTAMDGLDDRIEGLDAGGDDYLIKPFFLEELHARLRALVRRGASAIQTRMRVGDIELDLIARRATRAADELPLLPQELKLLEYLMRNAGSIVTRSMLLEHVWDIHFDPKTSVVESHMSRLRAKLSPGGGREYIRTVRGAGYVFVIQPPVR
jgi:two-component system OmpR family response regulator